MQFFGIIENENLHHSHKFRANVVVLRASPLRSGVVPNCPKNASIFDNILPVDHIPMYFCDILNSHEEYFTIQYPTFFDMKYSIQREKKYFRRRLKQTTNWGIFQLQTFLPFCNFIYSFPWYVDVSMYTICYFFSTCI